MKSCLRRAVLHEVFGVMERTQQVTNALRARLQTVYGKDGRSRDYLLQLLTMHKTDLLKEVSPLSVDICNILL